MDIEFIHQPGNTAAKIKLLAGETVTVEGGAMIAMSANLSVETTTYKKNKGGTMNALKRLFAGESLFFNHFTANQQEGEVWLGAALAGDMMTYELDNDTLIVQAGSFVACEQDVTMDTSWQGFKNFLSGESLFWLKVGGKGKVVLNSFGGIYPVEVNGEYIVDTGHIVAFSESLNFSLSKVGGSWLNSFLSGEGVVCRFKGRGTVWCQSHNPTSFGKMLTAGLKVRKA